MTDTSHNPAEHLAKLGALEFAQLASLNEFQIGAYWCEAGECSPWERHPDSDELLYVLDGEVEIEILPDIGAADTTRIGAGAFMVVPKGRWHRQRIILRTQQMYVSPPRTVHSQADDPRV